MATFSEIKELILKLCIVNGPIELDDDIAMSINGRQIVLKNDALQALLSRIHELDQDNLVLYDNRYRESIIKVLFPLPFGILHNNRIEDTDNGITYSVNSPSPEFTILFLDHLADYIRTNGSDDIIQNIRIQHRGASVDIARFTGTTDRPLELLSHILPFSTIKIQTEQDKDLEELGQLASSMEFFIMYKRQISVCELTGIEQIVDTFNRMDNVSMDEIADPPRRLFNPAVISYYTMAIESHDPFTIYISYYHIIEHYFDEVFKKNLIHHIQTRITHPDFSYQNDDSIYELAIYIKKHMKIDEETGKGNELESLKFVLKEYVDIEMLKRSIIVLDSDAISYYQDNIVSFTASEKTKIQWTNSEGVFTNLANRIYETRNALVHSKSEKIDKQYRPYEDKYDLIKELPLIRVVAEQVIINSGMDI